MQQMSKRLKGLSVLVSSLLLFVVSGVWGFQPSSRPHLPDFDKRTEAGIVAPKPERNAARAHLRARLPDHKLDWDDTTGGPRWIISANGFLSGPKGEGKGISAETARGLPPGVPHRAVKGFLREHAPLFGHDDSALNDARVTREFVTPHNGLRTVVWQQELDGLPVFEGTLISHTTRDGELVSVASAFVPTAGAAERRARNRIPPHISAAQAVAKAAGNLGEQLTAGAVVRLPERAQRRPGVAHFSAPQLKGDTEARLVWLPLRDTPARRCWEVLLTSRLRGEMFCLLVDAQTGDVWVRRCLTSHISPATYRVFTGDSPSPLSPGHATPSTNQPPLVARSLVTITALNTNASPNGWINDGGNETLGNNVDAHRDHDGNDQADLPRPQGNPTRVFDFSLNLNQDPTNYAAAAVVQLFYWCNWMHDKLYELGFTEAAGNFQATNFGRGGAEGDPLLADAQDGSDVDNAYMSTPPDGSSPRLEMFLFTGASPRRDGALDAEVILHEYTHGLTSRRVGGGGVGVLNALQSRGLAEGWSDFYALALLSEPADNPGGNYPIGGYVTFRSPPVSTNYYFGIRRYPYSTNLNANPLTFKDTDPQQLSSHPGVPRNPANRVGAADIHSLGEVWCAMLWDARARFITQHGFTAGNPMFLRLITDALNLTPANPTFIQARDAILQAEQVNHAGANARDLWAAFARRGLGISAQTPPSYTTTGVLEAFDVPDDLSLTPRVGFTSAGPANGPFSPNTQTHTLTNTGAAPLVWTAANTNSWLALSQSGGTLTPGGPVAAVTISLSPAAYTLPSGIYMGVVRFTNLTSGKVQSPQFILRVEQPDHFTEHFDASDNDLDFKCFTFTPDASVSFYSACRRTATAFFTDPAGGTIVSLTDDGYAPVTLTNGASVSLYGRSTNVFYISANGYLTFDGLDNAIDGTLEEHFDRLRISALFYDLNPAQQGVVSWKQLADRVAVTYFEVREFDTRNTNNFQIELFYDGTIRLTYLKIDGRRGGVGLSRGTGVPGNYLESDFDTYPMCSQPLRVTLPLVAQEGDGVIAGQGLVTLPEAAGTNLIVTLQSDDPTEVMTPTSVTVTAGETIVTFDLNITDDGILDGTHRATITASATGYAPGSSSVAVFDNEEAVLEVSLPISALEGTAGLEGTVSVCPTPEDDVLVDLFLSDPDAIQCSATVTIPAGQTSATFSFNLADNTRIDGSRMVMITADVANWSQGGGFITVLDNESTAITVTLPPETIETAGTLANAGTVRLSGTLPTNLVVTLLSGDANALAVPPTVTVTAGQTAAPFDLTFFDNATAGGSQTVAVTASAGGFTGGTAGILIVDDETPPVPFKPSPPHLGVDVPLTPRLSWSDLIQNGGFETGDFTGWTKEDFGAGDFLLNDGVFDPQSADGPVPPYLGNFNAMTDLPGALHSIHQELTIPAAAGSVTLRWAHRLRNHAGVFAGNQQFRVEIRDTNNSVLDVAYATATGDPLLQEWTTYSYDLTGFRSQTVRVVFCVENSAGFFNAHVDDVSVLVAAPGATTYDVYFGTNPSPGAAEFLGNTPENFWDQLPLLAAQTTYYWRVVAHSLGQATGAVWQFTTRGVDHFEWSAPPTPVRANEAFAATVTAKDADGGTVTNFTGSIGIAARITQADLTTSDGEETSPFPLAAAYHDARCQALYPAAELGGARTFTALALDVAGIPGQTLKNWTIRMRPSASSSYIAPAWEVSGWTTVYQYDETITSVGWANFIFSTPFVYDGVSHLMIDFSFNNSSGSLDGLCRVTETGQLRAIHAGADSQHGNPLGWSGPDVPTPLAAVGVPNVRLSSFVPFLGLTVTNAGPFVNGVWAANFIVPQPVTALCLRADDGNGHTGDSGGFTVIPWLDSDSDGIPDEWENTYEYDPNDPSDADQDHDNDGLNSREEYRAGTNPSSALSGLQIETISWLAGTLRLSFPSVAGKLYRVERAESPAGRPWTAVGGNLPGTGGIVNVDDPAAATRATSFYRIRLLP